MKKCPICNCELTYHKSEMNSFSWTNPYISCDCGFSFEQKRLPTGLKGLSCFENEAISKDDAERKIKEKFLISE